MDWIADMGSYPFQDSPPESITNSNGVSSVGVVGEDISLDAALVQQKDTGKTNSTELLVGVVGSYSEGGVCSTDNGKNVRNPAFTASTLVKGSTHAKNSFRVQDGF